MARKLRRMTIEPGKNGGHRVTHEFEPQAQYSKGMAGGMSMGAAPNEAHDFGPSEGNQLMKHVAQALALKGLGQPQGGLANAAAAPAPGGPEEAD